MHAQGNEQCGDADVRADRHPVHKGESEDLPAVTVLAVVEGEVLVDEKDSQFIEGCLTNSCRYILPLSEGCDNGERPDCAVSDFNHDWTVNSVDKTLFDAEVCE